MADMQITWKKKVVAWVLTICLVVTLLPEMAFATRVNAEQQKAGENQMKTTVLYGSPAKYENEEEKQKEYDASLIQIKPGEKSRHNGFLDEYAYRNKDGDKKQYFPETLSEGNPIILENNEYNIRITPTNQTMGDAS